MDEQQKVASFIEEHEMEAPSAYRLLDLVSELGEVAKDTAESTGYGESPEELHINSDEIGDVLFSLLALADAVEVEQTKHLMRHWRNTPTELRKPILHHPGTELTVHTNK